MTEPSEIEANFIAPRPVVLDGDGMPVAWWIDGLRDRAAPDGRGPAEPAPPRPAGEFDAELRALEAMGHTASVAIETFGLVPASDSSPRWRARVAYIPPLERSTVRPGQDREERAADTLAAAVDEARSMLRAAASDVAEHRRRQHEAASEALAAMLASGAAPTR